jgi:hypothetical protein
MHLNNHGFQSDVYCAIHFKGASLARSLHFAECVFQTKKKKMRRRVFTTDIYTFKFIDIFTHQYSLAESFRVTFNLPFA